MNGYQLHHLQSVGAEVFVSAHVGVRKLEHVSELMRESARRDAEAQTCTRRKVPSTSSICSPARRSPPSISGPAIPASSQAEIAKVKGREKTDTTKNGRDKQKL